MSFALFFCQSFHFYWQLKIKIDNYSHNIICQVSNGIFNKKIFSCEPNKHFLRVLKDDE